jgi:hypothetical protein
MTSASTRVWAVCGVSVSYDTSHAAHTAAHHMHPSHAHRHQSTHQRHADELVELRDVRSLGEQQLELCAYIDAVHACVCMVAVNRYSVLERCATHCRTHHHARARQSDCVRRSSRALCALHHTHARNTHAHTYDSTHRQSRLDSSERSCECPRVPHRPRRHSVVRRRPAEEASAR